MRKFSSPEGRQTRFQAYKRDKPHLIEGLAFSKRDILELCHAWKSGSWLVYAEVVTLLRLAKNVRFYYYSP